MESARCRPGLPEPEQIANHTHWCIPTLSIKTTRAAACAARAGAGGRDVPEKTFRTSIQFTLVVALRVEDPVRATPAREGIPSPSFPDAGSALAVLSR